MNEEEKIELIYTVYGSTSTLGKARKGLRIEKCLSQGWMRQRSYSEHMLLKPNPVTGKLEIVGRGYLP